VRYARHGHDHEIDRASAPKSHRSIMMVGGQDKVAPHGLSERYQAVAAQLGKKVRLVQLEGKEHDIFLDPAVFAELATMLQ
jgi:pimeloyl-ACP methyl ester carboxylesterase